MNLFRGKNLLWLLFGLLIISTIVDVFTAFRSTLFEIAELNPIWILTGSKGLLLMITVLVTIYIMYKIKHNLSYFGTYLFCIFAVYLIFGHAYGAYSNLSTTKTYETLQATNKTEAQKYYQELEQTTKDSKIQDYFLIVVLIMLMPIIISMVAFNLTFRIMEDKIAEREKVIGQLADLVAKLRFK